MALALVQFASSVAHRWGQILYLTALIAVRIDHVFRYICYLSVLQSIHKILEEKLAQFHEREDCILYASCFDANAGLFEVCFNQSTK